MQRRKVGIHGIFTALALASSVILAGCAKEGAAAKAETKTPVVSTGEDLPELVATIGDEKITRADVLDRVGQELDAIEAQYRRTKTKAIEEGINRILKEKVIDAEAAKKNMTMDQLIEAEAGPNLEPTEAEIADWYQRNQPRAGGRTLDQVRGQITNVLKSQRLRAARDKLVQRLNDERKVVILYQPYRLAFDNTGAPTLGKKDAPVTVVEFSDFQCPFCYQFAPTLKRINSEFGDKVQVVYRQLPIVTIHPFAFKAAEASLCAQEQEKFWQMHDAMFADQKKLGVADLKATARRLGMDSEKFNTCLDTGKFTEQVQKDMIEGNRYGITGTPAVFVNGIHLEGGAVPYETVAEVIKKELERVGKSE